jgi:hypothetical protein
MPRTLIAIAAIAGALVLTAGAGTASAATPCWRTVINDWYDGSIDGHYSASCYRQALTNAPDDLKMYSDLPEDLNRALQVSLRSGGGGRSLSGRKPPRGPVGKVLDGLGPSRADALPIPLLVLAGLALLLVAAGAVGVATRRFASNRSPSDDPPA